jgi:hypothetical protein
MEAWHGEEGGKVVNRDGGVAWRGGGEGRQQGWRRGMERRGGSSTGMEMEVWRSPKISENDNKTK